MSDKKNRACWCNICQGNGPPICRKNLYKHLKLYGELVTGNDDLPSSEPDLDSVCHSDSSLTFNDDEESKDTSLYIDADSSYRDMDETGDNGDDSDVSSDDDGNSSDNDLFHSEDDSQTSANSNLPWIFDYDKKLYSNGIAVQKLGGSDLSLLQWLAMNFTFFSGHPTISKQAFTDNLKLQKATWAYLQIENILPSSYREARKMIDPYLIKKIVFSVCPNDCIIYRNSEKYSFANLTTCPVCDEERYFNKDAKRPVSKRKYSYIPVGPRLARLYGETNLAQLVQAHPGSQYELDKGLDMWDVHDSPMWKEIYSENGFFHGDKMGLSLAFEMDGVNPFHNVGIIYSMTPIMLTILNLPRHIRNAFGNILLVGIIPGKGRSEASNLDPYIEILVDELIFLSGCTAYSMYSNAPVDVKIKLLLYVLDYPGLSKVFKQHGSGGLSGCHWCHVRGIHCAHLDKVVYLHNRSFLKNDDTMRDDVNNFRDKCEDRTCAIKLRSSKSENEYRTAYEHAKSKTHASTLAAATGCKGTYTLSQLPGHKRHQESLPDACHTIKDVVQNIVHLITGKNVNIPKIIAAETAYGRFSNDIPANQLSADGQFVSKTKMCLSTTKRRKIDPQISKTCLPQFLLSKQDIKDANDKAETLRVPIGFGLKPARFISNTGCLKSHDWKQLATQGILKFCLKDAESLGEKQRETLFALFDCLSDLCAESQSLDELDDLENRVNQALARLERDFPISLQNITTHLLHHIVQGIKMYGPVYGTWMYVFERFNSWICKRTLNMRYPEATAVETFLIFDWCNFMASSGKLCSQESKPITAEYDELLMKNVPQNDVFDAKFDLCIKALRLTTRKLNLVHQLCKIDTCENCAVEKYYCHRETHPITNRTDTYNSCHKEQSSAKTVSSVVCWENNRGSNTSKVVSGGFLTFGQIQFFIEHKNLSSVTHLAYVGLFEDPHYDRATGLWHVNATKIVKYTYVLTRNISPPLVTAIQNGQLWICNCGKKQFN